jgi:hypothetical protein
MALLNAQPVSPAGSAVTYAAAAGGGDTFRPADDRALLLVVNGGGSPITVTIPSFASVSGLVTPARTVSVPAGATRAIPLLKRLYANPANGLIDIGYSGVTSVTVAVISN